MLVLFDITCIAVLLALLLTPLVRNMGRRLGLVDRPDNERKFHLVSVPRVGGVGVMLAYALALLFVVVAPYRNLTFDVPQAVTSALRLAPAVVLVFIVGLIDDIRGLRPWQKLIGEVAAAVLAYQFGFGVHVLHGTPLDFWVSLPLTVVWLVGCANALNLIDGLDGLAAGVGVFATLTSFVAALVHNSLELAIVTAPLAGALIGFLRYNFNPASIFLGDCGSLTIGFLLGCFGAVWSQKSATVLGMTAPLIALALPLLDTTMAVVRRFLRRQPIMAPDHGHIHHMLLERGLTPRRAALALYGACGLAAALSVLQDVAHNRFGGLVVILFCAGAWIGVQHLGYAEFGLAGRLILRGTLRSMIGDQLRLQQFERALNATQTLDEAWPVMSAGAVEFGFASLRLRIQDRVFDSTAQSVKTGFWQVRVPLGGDQYLNLIHNPAENMSPSILAGFPKLIERFVGERFAGSAPGEHQAEDAASKAVIH